MKKKSIYLLVMLAAMSMSACNNSSGGNGKIPSNIIYIIGVVIIVFRYCVGEIFFSLTSVSDVRRSVFFALQSQAGFRYPPNFFCLVCVKILFLLFTF